MKLLTTGGIAQKLNVDRDRVSYALRKLALQPASIAGQTRVFPESSLAAVKAFLDVKAQPKRTSNDPRNQ